MAKEEATRGSNRLTAYVEPGLLERAKSCAFWTPGMTLSGLVALALEAELERRERERGEPFPPRSGDLPKGRPLA